MHGVRVCAVVQRVRLAEAEASDFKYSRAASGVVHIPIGTLSTTARQIATKIHQDRSPRLFKNANLNRFKTQHMLL